MDKKKTIKIVLLSILLIFLTITALYIKKFLIISKMQNDLIELSKVENYRIAWTDSNNNIQIFTTDGRNSLSVCSNSKSNSARYYFKDTRNFILH